MDRSPRLVDPFATDMHPDRAKKLSSTSNAIATSKYTLYNFLPLCLLQEFRRAANVYFLVIAIVQSIPQLSPLPPITAIAPLGLVLAVEVLREALKDYKKRTSDNVINSKAVVVIRKFATQHIEWERIQVGDLVRVHEREAIPADGIVLSSSEENGSCLIDTSNLNGEANLNVREALKATTKLVYDATARDKERYFVTCDDPDQEVGQFHGNLSIESKTYSLSETQFLPRGATLRNTKWVMMLVVYTGHDTKMMKNARVAHHKLSHLETRLSHVLRSLFLLQVLLCTIAVCVHFVHFDSNQIHPSSASHSILELLLLFLSFIVLLNTLVPISLVITLEIIKTVHAKFITWDNMMRSSKGEGAIANTSALTDELGQVKYLFTDKTGTLTQNRMVFRKCSVGGVVYTSRQHPSLQKSILTASLDNGDANELSTVSCFRRKLTRVKSRESHLALAMALCHTVICDYDRITGALSYTSDSPDECALVQGADVMGVKLFERCGQKLYIALTEEERLESRLKTVTKIRTFDILHVLPFSSERKRMTVIVREESGGVKLFCKGADSVILDRCDAFLSKKEDTTLHVTQFAEEGYRTLVFAERDLEEKYYRTWQDRYEKAGLDLHLKESKTQALMDEIEQHFTLIGASAVEDKLQAGVPETISLFQKAGIKIWVLTGDKLETSLEIGKLCRVVTPQMQETIIRGATRDEFIRELDHALRNLKEKQVVVIDGKALTFALHPSHRLNFLKLALQSTTVIVCRASPLQKALVVELVKAGVPEVTLAVGDGANDVSMIRAAHVGVGIVGHEGMQAIRSADYAVQEFRHLERLLLYHGRLSYLRTAQCIDYFLYKNIVFTLPQFLYGIFSAFSAQTFFCDWYITAYNVAFTALPVTIRALLETDLLDALASKYPELYRFEAVELFFSPRTMGKALTTAVCHALVATVVPLVLAQYNNIGAGDLFWAASVVSFVYIVPIVHVQLGLETWNWTSWSCRTYTLSLSGFLLSLAVYDQVSSDVQGVWRTVLLLPGFWLGFAWSLVAASLPVVAFKW